MPHTKKHHKHHKTEAKQQSIIGVIWEYTKNIASYVSLTNIVKLLAISSAASTITGVSAAQCQTHMQIPFSCSQPVINPLAPQDNLYVLGFIPEQNFTTAQILCKISTDYTGKEGVDFTFEHPVKACQLKQDGSCTEPFTSLVHKDEVFSIIAPSFSTAGERRPPELEVLFPQCDYHERECLSTQSSLFISCAPK